MKNLLSIIFFISVLAGFSQIDRSKKPAPAPAKEIKIGEYEKFKLKNGLKVIVVENHKLPRVAFSLILDRDPILEKDKVGYLSMVGQLMRSGTNSRSKAQLDEEVDYIGATLFTSSTSVFGSSLTKHRDKMLDLFTDVLYNPSFPQEELDKIKKQTISGLKASEEDPNSISGNVRSRLLYGADHPYGEIQTEDHVENITVEDIKAYYETYFMPNAAYLVIVGDINAKEAKKIVKERFGSWERGELPRHTYPKPEAPKKNTIAIVDRPSAVQTVLNIGYPIDLKPGSPESIKARVMNQILGGSSASRLFMNIREDKGYTYGAYSSISSDELVGNFSASASVRTEVTDSSVHEFLYEMERIRNEKVEEDELQLAKNVIIGAFGRSLESPQTIATFAVNTERYNLPEDYYNNYVKNIEAVTADDVMDMANRYIKPEGTYIIAVGKANEIASKLERFGEVKYMDNYGNEVDPMAASLPDGLTAEKVLKSYIDAIGGMEKLEAVKSVTMKMEGSVMGQVMNLESSKMAPNLSLTEVKMGGNVVQKEIFDGESGKRSGMQGTQMVTGDDAKDMAVSSALFEELTYLNETSVKTKVIAVEQMEGRDIYGVEVVYPSGKTSTRYYNAENGLLVKVSNTIKTPQGATVVTTEIVEYGVFDGIKFPVTIRQPLGPQMKMDIKVTEVMVNPELSMDMFKLD
ncbi:MAG: hypothetical protein Tsb0034_28870 [Ekhidna sp.]